MAEVTEGGLRSKLVRGGMGVGGLKLISLPLSLALSVLLARALGPEGFGQYSFIMSIVAIISLPFDKGMQQLITREVAGYHRKKNWALLRGLMHWAHQRVMYGSVLCAIIIGFIAIYNANWREHDRWELMLVGLCLPLFLGLNALRGASLRGLGYVIYAQIPELIVKPGFHFAAAGILFVIGILNPLTALFSHVLAACCAFLVGAFLFAKKRPLEMQTEIPESRNSEWTRAWVPFTMFMAASMFNNQIGILLLGWFGNDAQIAALRVADRGAHIVAFSLAIVNFVIAPHITHAYQDGNKQRLQKLSRQSVRVAFFIALPVALPLVLFGAPIIGFVFGTEYINLAVTPLAILAASQLFNVAFGSVGLFLVMSGFERDTLFGQVVALLVNVVACIVLIPKLGAVGAAYAAAVGLITWNCILAFLVFKRLEVRPGII